jgi:fructose/tagatose bisphosphate aldolase
MLLTDRQHVLEVYARAAERRWVLPCFCSENLTTTEAVLTAARDHAATLGCPDLPVILALTVQYPPRPQARYYTHTGDWATGLRLFLADLRTLAAPDAPFGRLRVLAHLDHVQPDADAELLAWDLAPFSSVMFDASTLPLEDNIVRTRAFVERHGRDVVVEGACDEIAEATGPERVDLTTPEQAERYLRGAGVDFIVANLGTEHRASAATLRYHGDRARAIAARIGPRIVLHGGSSVPADRIRNLFDDGVCKANLWTALERDSAPELLADMVAHAAKVAGPRAAAALRARGLLGERCDLTSAAALTHFPTRHRQEIVFGAMRRIAGDYFRLWYR